jgi:hypothetical protein
MPDPAASRSRSERSRPETPTNGSTTIYFDPFAEFGDLILGTGLVAAAAVAIFDSAWRNQPIS